MSYAPSGPVSTGQGATYERGWAGVDSFQNNGWPFAEETSSGRTVLTIISNSGFRCLIRIRLARATRSPNGIWNLPLTRKSPFSCGTTTSSCCCVRRALIRMRRLRAELFAALGKLAGATHPDALYLL